MGVDLRQLVAGVLTLTMFVMLGNMIKTDHYFDFITEKLPGDVQGLFTLTKRSSGRGPWLEDGSELKPCWSNTSFDEIIDEYPRGFVITFSLTNGPEYPVSHIADAVIIARHLQGTLAEVNEVVDSVVERLRTLSRIKSDGQFIAVDLRVDLLEHKGCHESNSFYSALEIASDVFVPAAISGMFYTNVAGNRIASGKNQILVPADISSSSASDADFVSPCVLKKKHLAHSCFC
ncbi:hypothetical protein Dsin_020503 [Dipteronia sinensis]|uniref:Uncharacterized protein n=1 Tax=Dipteronia sinensis TaxID=43782 RepID=A0AAE0E3J8_9ROSI|nr:hypothetical protein Dsin_020503 [Dipteronia sinensis]